MQGLGIVAAIIVGGFAGWIASSIMKANTGLITNIILGIVGAIVGNFTLGLLGLATSPTWISQGVAGLIGACILIALIRLIRGR
ncbi:GlsB/YeaQ/YmgE family stress response membrane protein [Gymnodinialimonas sp. 2305UL16-5]|uniref:GlsB/YeaQ/YmgE family stress response membrane protein n=1 Tax=Gymnodinialimonas mytili TaxID=3126503 RepID=UPI0030A25E97